MRNTVLKIGVVIVLALSAFPLIGTASAQDEETPRCDANWLSVAASAIGVEEDALRDALADGQTIADIAEANDVDPDAVVEALVAHLEGCVDQLPARMGRRFRNNLETLAESLVYDREMGVLGLGRGLAIPRLEPEIAPHLSRPRASGMVQIWPMPLEGWRGATPLMAHDWIETAADAIGIETDALLEALADGQTIADVAEAHDVDPQTVIDAIMAAESEDLAESVEAFVNEPFEMPMAGRFSFRVEPGEKFEFNLPFDLDWLGILPFGERGQGRLTLGLGMLGQWGDWLTVAAEAIGIDKDALTEALNDGQTIAEVAEANDVEPDAVVKALTDHLNAQIDEWLTDGRLTETRADQLREQLSDRVETFVNEGIFRLRLGQLEMNVTPRMGRPRSW